MTISASRPRIATRLILLVTSLRHLSTSATASSSTVNPTLHQSFADTLTTKLYMNDNECSSALGVSMAFSLIYPGCTGDAIKQIQNVLGYENIDEGDNLSLVWEETTVRLLENAAGQCSGGEWDGVCSSEAPLLKIANSIWFDNENTLNAEYAQVVGDFGKQIDLSAEDSSLIVNQWVNDQTNGLIETIVDESKPLYPPYELVAINSIYLKASWKKPFGEEKTNLDSFYSSAKRENEVSKAHFMNGVFDRLNYSHEALQGYQVVQLPFAESQMSMIFVLPISSEEDSTPVTSRQLLPTLDNLEMTRVALSIPKFNFESTYDDVLKSAIMQMGVTAPFRGGSLCGLFESDDNCNSLFIDKVIQKTVIDVHEIGVEAAAVTAIMVGRTSAMQLDDPILMVCDHPFQFFIHDKLEDLVLFEGRVGKPEVPEKFDATSQPLLDRGHLESDFWFKTFGANPVDPLHSAVTTPKNPADDSPPSQASANQTFIKRGFSLIIGLILAFAVSFLL